MALDAADLIDGMMNEQARVNSAIDAGDINNLVADTTGIQGERVGLIESFLTTVWTSPHILDEDAYSRAVMVDTPTVYWRLWDTFGGQFIFDFVNPGTDVNKGQVLGGVTLEVPGPLSGPGVTRAATLNGTTGYATAGALGLAGNFSFEAWVNHGGVAWAASLETVVASGGQGTYMGVNNGALFGSAVLGGVQQTVTGGAVSATGWHHLVVTWDGTTLRTYIDGVAGATAAPVGGATTMTGATLIGSFDTTTLFLNGSVSEVVVYPAALSAARVTAHYAARTAALQTVWSFFTWS